MTRTLAVVIATKDRPEDLCRLLESLREQTVRPHQVVIVDASRETVEPVLASFPELNLRYLRHWPPSASAQRNTGIQACGQEFDFIGFVDDDATFEPAAVENMLRFWDSASPDVLGASCNILNYSPPGGQWLKKSALVRWLGLYAPEPGAVAPSGWQTVMTEATRNLSVEWLPSCAVFWRSDVFAQNRFDEFFDGYSYLEDLDFSYSAGRRGRLVVVADAGYSHFPSAGGRVSTRQFGRVEVRNRLYFVRKHGLSLWRCRLGIAIRLVTTALSGLVRLDGKMFGRAAGNLEALVPAYPPAKKLNGHGRECV